MRWAITPICSTATMSATGSTRIWDSPMPTGWRTSAASPKLGRLMVDAGLIVLVSFISPFRSERLMARELVETANSSRCSSTRRWRSPRPAIPRASMPRRGAARSRISPASLRPMRRLNSPEIRIDTAHRSAEEAAGDIVGFLDQAGRLTASAPRGPSWARERDGALTASPPLFSGGFAAVQLCRPVRAAQVRSSSAASEAVRGAGEARVE